MGIRGAKRAVDIFFHDRTIYLNESSGTASMTKELIEPTEAEIVARCRSGDRSAFQKGAFDHLFDFVPNEFS